MMPVAWVNSFLSGGVEEAAPVPIFAFSWSLA
jgi:hypothetical protein